MSALSKFLSTSPRAVKKNIKSSITEPITVLTLLPIDKIKNYELHSSSTTNKLGLLISMFIFQSFEVYISCVLISSFNFNLDFNFNI